MLTVMVQPATVSLLMKLPIQKSRSSQADTCGQLVPLWGRKAGAVGTRRCEQRGEARAMIDGGLYKAPC